jgi:4-hydroxy-3-methylbut-2-en-1-yl diphosphate reductase
MLRETTRDGPATSTRGWLLIFNSRHQVWVEGQGTASAPWTPPGFPSGERETTSATDDEEAVTALLAVSWSGAGRPQLFLDPSVKNEHGPVWWARWDHGWSETPAPGGRGPGRWLALRRLREGLDRAPETLAPVWRSLLPPLFARAIEIPYLNFGPNQFIYRFRTDKQRNRQVYQDDETSQRLYQSHLCAAVKVARRLKENRSGEPARLDFGAVEYILPSHFGFCLGVQNAIERAYEVIAEHPGRRVFMLSELIHNPFVNRDLQRRGLRYLQTDKGASIDCPATGRPYWDGLTEEDIVIIPAFGATNEDKVRLVERGLALNEFDATCMLVEKVWKAGRRFAEDGYTVIIHGKAEHEETKATFSNIARRGPALVVRDLSEAEALATIIRTKEDAERERRLEEAFAGKTTPGFAAARDLERLAVVNQTTLLRNETLRIIDTLEAALAERAGTRPEAHLHPQSRGDTLCYATQVNQDALQRTLAEPLDLALVAGGKNSSNTYQLYRVCQAALGERAAYIQSEENLLPGREVLHYHFAQSAQDPRGGTFSKGLIHFPPDRPMKVLITGGASCPDGIIQQLITRLNGYFPAETLHSIEAVLARLEPGEG